VGVAFAYSNVRRSESIEGKMLLTTTLALGELGGPAVHLAHGRSAVAARDLAVRAFVPGGCALLGFLIGTLATGDVERGANGAGAGYLVGAATAVAIDAFWFAREPVEPPA
jgi:hypothetical protein